MIQTKNFFVETEFGKHHVQSLIPEKTRDTATLIFLHDALGSIPQWKDFPRLVVEKTHRSALIIEREGYGQSSPLRAKRDINYLHHEGITVLPWLLEELEVKHPVLIGHSDGGSIALLYAIHYKPLAIITLAAHTFVEEVTLTGIREAVLHQDYLQSRLQKYHGEKTKDLFRAWSDTWLSDEFKAWDFRAELSKITCPTLVIQGADDEYGTRLQVESITTQIQGKVESLILPGVKHVPHMEAPSQVVEDINRFLQLINDR